jgi:polyisoprenoid-binding protein YceI
MPRTWQFDPSYTTVEFSVKRFWFFTVKGCFEQVEGVISADDADVTKSSVTAKIKVDSLKTGSKRRDAELASLFDEARFPDIEFSSTSISRGQDRDMLDVVGALTVKGKSQQIKLSVSEMDRSRSPKGEEFVYYSATTVLDVIGRQLKVTINVQAILATDEHG